MLAKEINRNFNIFSPGQLRTVRDIYSEISRRPWFVEDAAKKEEFASYVIKMYQRGLVDPVKLQSLCLVAAKRKFSQTARIKDSELV